MRRKAHVVNADTPAGDREMIAEIVKNAKKMTVVITVVEV